MQAKAEIEAGVCGFRTTVRASSDDGMYVELAVDTNCEKIGKLAAALKNQGPVNAYDEINPATESVIMATARATLPGCCAGCVVPVGVF